MTQRLENTEKGSKNDITELFSRIKRYEEEARIDNDEVKLHFQQKQNISFLFVNIRIDNDEVKPLCLYKTK